MDVLVNNAGLIAMPQRQTADGYEMQLGVNHPGHWTLTALLMSAILTAPSASPSSRTTTSRRVCSGNSRGPVSGSTGMDVEDGAMPQIRSATDLRAKGGEFYGPRFVNLGRPVRLSVAGS